VETEQKKIRGTGGRQSDMIGSGKGSGLINKFKTRLRNGLSGVTGKNAARKKAFKDSPALTETTTIKRRSSGSRRGRKCRSYYVLQRRNGEQRLASYNTRTKKITREEIIRRRERLLCARVKKYVPKESSTFSVQTESRTRWGTE